MRLVVLDRSAFKSSSHCLLLLYTYSKSAPMRRENIEVNSHRALLEKRLSKNIRLKPPKIEPSMLYKKLVTDQFLEKFYDTYYVI